MFIFISIISYVIIYASNIGRFKKIIKISLDGNIGAGKTTFLNNLKEKFDKIGLPISIVVEPVDIWESLNLLKMFYEDKQ